MKHPTSKTSQPQLQPQPPPSSDHPPPSSFLSKAFLIGLTLRLLIASTAPLLLDDDKTGVRYTDVDYFVFIDAADHVLNGRSPYERRTYRYTPFLAEFLSWGGGWFGRYRHLFGRYAFGIADAVCGLLIFRCRERSESGLGKSSLIDAVWWLYNPLAINICTRGSAESLMVLLPVLLTLSIATSNFSIQQSTNKAAFVCGILHGLAIHAKLYPIIYTLSFAAYFYRLSGRTDDPKPRTKWQLLPPIIFLATTTVIFVTITALAVHLHGYDALSEGLLYHFGRLDHRHNYSMYWYPIYLNQARHETKASAVINVVLKLSSFASQSVLLFLFSVGVAPYDLPLALFCQTFIFVAFNKVVTAQYFTWYLCLLPLCSSKIQWSDVKVRNALAFIGLSVLHWLGWAYMLEMRGLPVHLGLFLASLMFFAANVHFMLVSLDGLKYYGDSHLQAIRQREKKQD